MTLFDLVKRSMRQNIKHYYLYFFALIFSVVLYFVFATLQHDAAVIQQTEASKSYSGAFQAASVLLIGIAGIFIIYANTIFLRRRSREIGLYQLIGLTRGAVARLLIIENILLNIGALIIGIGAGLLVSRLFLLLLMKVIGQGGFIALSFSMAAVVQTIVVFLLITFLTSIQMLFTVRKKTLLELFNAEHSGEHPKKPTNAFSALFAILGIALIAYGYWQSGDMFSGSFLLNVFSVLGSTILGTYLIFRISISWLFYRLRQSKNGFLSLKDSLSIAPLMHRMKGNAKSLTIITVLSAMTLAMIAGSYSLYYSTEVETRYQLPHDFMFVNEEKDATDFKHLLDEHHISSNLTELTFLKTVGVYENFVYTGFIDDTREGEHNFAIYNATQLKDAGFPIENIQGNVAVYFDPLDLAAKNFVKEAFDIQLIDASTKPKLHIEEVGAGTVVNFIDFDNAQLVVSDEVFEQLEAEDKFESQAVYALNVTDESQLEAASTLFQSLPEDLNGSEDYFLTHSDYYSAYKQAMEANGLLIFIAGFLGLVFLISTGSILYFKQMSEAEQEKKSYATLRQLGFTVPEIMRGIIRKQVFVFSLPLAIGILHSIFAIKSVSLLFTASIIAPVSIAIIVYAMIYFLFALLTIGYYKKMVSQAL